MPGTRAWTTTSTWIHRPDLLTIKPTNYDQKRSRKFKKQVGRVENMTYDPEENSFTCVQGRKLPLRRECTEQREGQFVSTAWYRCEDCTGCPCRSQCCRAKDPTRPKELHLQKTFGKTGTGSAADCLRAWHPTAPVPFHPWWIWRIRLSLMLLYSVFPAFYPQRTS